MKNICKLCLEHKKLCNSHIIPEFFYKNLYDGYNRFYQISTAKNSKPIFHQKGTREYLLCKNCEQHLNKNETYTKKLFFDDKKLLLLLNANNPFSMISGIDYKHLKLLQLSILWRASISTKQFFSDIKLSNAEEEDLRKNILQETPREPDYYGCSISQLNLGTKSVKNFFEKPDSIISDDITAYRFVFNLQTWIYFDSSKYLDETIKETFLNESGEMKIVNIVTQKIPFIHEPLKMVNENGSLQKISSYLNPKKT